MLGINFRDTQEWEQNDHLKGYYNDPGESYWWFGVAVEMVRSGYILNIV